MGQRYTGGDSFETEIAGHPADDCSFIAFGGYGGPGNTQGHDHPGKHLYPGGSKQTADRLRPRSRFLIR